MRANGPRTQETCTSMRASSPRAQETRTVMQASGPRTLETRTSMRASSPRAQETHTDRGSPSASADIRQCCAVVEPFDHRMQPEQKTLKPAVRKGKVQQERNVAIARMIPM